MKYVFQVLNRMGPWGWVLVIFALACSIFPIIVLPYVTIPILLAIAWTLWHFLLKPLSSNARIADVGVEATATVLGAQENGTSMQIGGSIPKAGMNILVEVYPNGQASFQAIVKAYVSPFELQRVAVGQTLRVKYDPENHAKVIILDITGPLDLHQA